MGRLLLFVLIALAVYLMVKGSTRRSALRDRDAPSRAAMARGEDMVTCARCGVNVPKSEARAEGGRLVCADNPRCRPAS
jgi:uncharacterized protein